MEEISLDELNKMIHPNMTDEEQREFLIKFNKRLDVSAAELERKVKERAARRARIDQEALIMERSKNAK